MRVTGYLGHWVDEYVPGGEDGLEPQWCAVSHCHAVPVEISELRFQETEVSDARWFAADELPAELAPPAHEPAIYAAWRAARDAAELETPLLDLG